MESLIFKTEINASPETVWFALWDDAHYRLWTKAFHEGSFYKTDWKEGGRIHFLDNEGSGMYSNITKNAPNEKMFFTHIGIVKNFEEQPLDDNTRQWTNGKEKYYLTEKDGVTTLTVELDMMSDENMVAYFNDAFPKGLALIKQAAENFMIIVSTEINASIDAVWQAWNNPEAIKKWNAAAADWHTTNAEVDLREGGKFCSTMAAKDGSISFDFSGKYTKIIPQQLIEYTLDDDRKVSISFKNENGKVKITESFEPENENTIELQKNGWQNILDNFKQFVNTKN